MPRPLLRRLTAVQCALLYVCVADGDQNRHKEYLGGTKIVLRTKPLRPSRTSLCTILAFWIPAHLDVASSQYGAFAIECQGTQGGAAGILSQAHSFLNHTDPRRKKTRRNGSAYQSESPETALHGCSFH